MGFKQKNLIFNFEFLILNLVLILCVACNHVSTPKPYGYYRITLPDTSYIPFEDYRPTPNDYRLTTYPYSFALSQNAVVQPRSDVDERIGSIFSIHVSTLLSIVHTSLCAIISVN